MKKVLAFASVAMLAVGLAFYTSSHHFISILDEDIEALTDGDGPGGDAYQVFGEFPNRIIVDNITHVVTFEGKQQAENKKGKPINACSDETGGTCTINTTTTVYNLSLIWDYIEDFFKNIFNGSFIANWLKSLLN